MQIPHGINQGRNAPSLSRARISTVGPMGVGQLWQALPTVFGNVLLVRNKPFHGGMRGFRFGFEIAKEKLSFEEEADWPDPLWALMVVPAMRVVRVDVIAIVLSIFWIQSLDSHAALFHEDVCDIIQTCFGICWVEKLWSIAHCDAEIGSQLVVSARGGRTIDVFVDSTSMHSFGVDIVTLVISFVCGNPEASFKAVFHPCSPV